MGDFDKELWPGWDIVRKIGSDSFGAVYDIEDDFVGLIPQDRLMSS